jgi:hypothetical protein
MGLNRPHLYKTVAADGQSEDEAIRVLIDRHGGRLIDVAAELGIRKQELHKMLLRLDLVGYARGVRERIAQTYRL